MDVQPRVNKFPKKQITQYYHELDKLGKGTFGEVYKCQRIGTTQLVALKKLKHKLEDGVSPLRLREVDFYLHVPPHENLVGLHEIFIDQLTGSICFSLELMGGTLMQYLDHHRRVYKKPLSPNNVIRLSMDILKGMDHIHRCGYVHRDVKPENILVKRKGSGFVVKLTDFGLARKLDKAVNTNWTGYVATRWYRAPEQLLEASPHGSGLDIWSFSTILSEICNLEPLFPGKDSNEMLIFQASVLGPPDNYSAALLDYDFSFHNANYWDFKCNDSRSCKMKRLFDVVAYTSHLCFVSIIIRGLAWDPKKRPSAYTLLQEFAKISDDLYRQQIESRSQYMTPELPRY